VNIAAPEEPRSGIDPVVGERSIASVNEARSLQSRVSNVLAVGLMSTLGIGLLGWYYVHTFAHQREVKQQAQAASRHQAVGEMALPSLGHIEPPAPAPTPTAAPLLGPPPPLPVAMTTVPADALNPLGSPSAAAGPPAAKPAWMVALERRLAGPVSAGPGVPKDTVSASSPPETSTGAAGSPPVAQATAGGEGTLASLLRPTATPATRAEVLPAQRLLLPKGAFIDCTLETAMDSTLPGMTTCITATDTFGVDGSTVLIERGSKLVGETHGQVAQGQSRLFVLWTEVRTPTGVIVPLDSPGTDELGRSGLSGEVNRHFLQRFGAAILISVITGVVQAATTHDGGGTVIYNPSTSTDVLTEVLRSTVNIPPTITKNQGDRIQVFVARDLDFRSVYELKTAAH
jgi:type IV secretion system protein VirB10